MIKETVPAAVVREAVATAATFFPRLIDALTRVAGDLLREDRLGEGLALFSTCQDGIKWFCQMVELRSVWMGIDQQAVLLDEKWPSFIQTMASAADALAARDYVLLSDLLLYEVVPFMEDVLAIVQGLEEEPVGHAV